MLYPCTGSKGGPDPPYCKSISRDGWEERSWLLGLNLQGRSSASPNAQPHSFVETVPKRGYRFLGPQSNRRETFLELADPPNDLERLIRATAPIAQGRNRFKKHGTAAAAIIALATGGAFIWHHRTRAAPLSNKDTLVIADFLNTAGDPVFDGTLRLGLTVQLEQSPFLSIISDERIQQTLGLMRQPPDTKLIPATAREICQRTASAAVLNGSIAKVSTRLPFDASGGRLRKRENTGKCGGSGERRESCAVCAWKDLCRNP